MVYSAIETTCFGLKGAPPKIERSNTVATPGLKVYAAPRRIPPSPHCQEDFSLFVNFSLFTKSSCTRNRGVRGLM